MGEVGIWRSGYTARINQAVFVDEQEMILNPWFLVGLLAWSALAAGTGYWKGHKSAQDAAGAAHARELDATIAQWRENALVDAQAAFEHGLKQQETRIQFRDRVQTVERIVREKPTDCRTSDDAYDGLLDAIRAANATITPAAKHGTVPADAGAAKLESR